MERIFVLGDVHGAFRALKQCFERAGFDHDNDRLISLGDICDGWPETRQCLDELLKVKKLEYIMGNHDTWFRDWLKTGAVADIWYRQGGMETIAAYENIPAPATHIEFFERARNYHVYRNKLFVHAGFEAGIPVHLQSEATLLWDRQLAQRALRAVRTKENDTLTEYDEVYIGHTPIASARPLCGGGVWLMDTGAGWSGVLSLMEVNTKALYTSDPVPSLYPGVQGRQKH